MKANAKGLAALALPIWSSRCYPPSTASYDMVSKRLLYESFGVREYLIVDPERRLVMAFRLENGKYTNMQIVPEDEILTSIVLPGLEIDLRRAFG